jgi:hypothetical protein
MVDFDTDELVKGEWKTAMDKLRSTESITVDILQRVWWLFPLYKEEPAELEELLTAIIEEKAEQTNESFRLEDSHPTASGAIDEDTGRNKKESSVSPVPDDGLNREDDSIMDFTTADRDESAGESNVTTASTASVDNESKEEPEHSVRSDDLETEPLERSKTSIQDIREVSEQAAASTNKYHPEKTQGPGEQPPTEQTSATGGKNNVRVAEEVSSTSESAGSNNREQLNRTVEENTMSAETGITQTQDRSPGKRQSNQLSQNRNEREDTSPGFVGRIRSFLGL